MGITESLAKRSVRVFGSPPLRGAPQIETYVYARRIYSRMLPFLGPVWILLAVNAATWAWIVLGVSALGWLEGFIWFSFRIKRVRDAPPNG
jgi:hypothetical protein